MPKLKGNYCNVDGCVNRSEDDEDQRHYYRLPAIISHLSDFEKDLSTERRRLWLSQLNKDLTGKNLANIRICSDHFVNKKRAELWQRDSPDWIPTVNMYSFVREKADLKSPDARARHQRNNVYRKKKVGAARTFMSTASTPQFPDKEEIEHERGTATQVHVDMDQPLFEAVQAEHIHLSKQYPQVNSSQQMTGAATLPRFNSLPWSTGTWNDCVKSSKSALRWDIKNSMKSLCKRLTEVGEECVIITVNVTNGWVGHIGSTKGDEYIEDRPQIPWDFLQYCRESIPSNASSDAEEDSDTKSEDDENSEFEFLLYIHVFFYLESSPSNASSDAEEDSGTNSDDENSENTESAESEDEESDNGAKVREPDKPPQSNQSEGGQRSGDIEKAADKSKGTDGSVTVGEETQAGNDVEMNVEASETQTLIESDGIDIKEERMSDEDEDTDEMDSCPDLSAQDTTSADEEPTTSQSKKVRPAPVPGRFARIDDEEIYKFQEVNQSAATKKNTKWGLKLFQEWHTSVFEEPLDMETVDEPTLAKRLTKFYCEARPQVKDQEQQEYHRHTLKNIRGAVNRHLQDIGRNIDIVRDKEFKLANKTMDGVLKSRLHLASVRPHVKDLISTDDLDRIDSYLRAAPTDTILLRQCVWFQLSIHFVVQGHQFHKLLTKDSFVFTRDTDDREYVTLTEEARKNNTRGGKMDESMADKRMYATGETNCPVEMLRLLIKKTVPTAKRLFNKAYSECVKYPNAYDFWYDDKPLKNSSFVQTLQKICHGSKCSKTYTVHGLKETAMSIMNHAIIETHQNLLNQKTASSHNLGIATSQNISSRNTCIRGNPNAIIIVNREVCSK